MSLSIFMLPIQKQTKKNSDKNLFKDIGKESTKICTTFLNFYLHNDSDVEFYILKKTEILISLLIKTWLKKEEKNWWEH